LPIYADDVRLRVPSIEKAQHILGWKPTVKVDDALERCIGVALESHGLRS
jgi:nucleoside-diphosphate-sugar epimerase